MGEKGEVLYRQQRYLEALEAYEHSIKIHPKYAAIWYRKGQTLYCLQQYEEAQICCNKALELDPNNSDFQKLKNEISKILMGINQG